MSRSGDQRKAFKDPRKKWQDHDQRRGSRQAFKELAKRYIKVVRGRKEKDS